MLVETIRQIQLMITVIRCEFEYKHVELEHLCREIKLVFRENKIELSLEINRNHKPANR